MEARPLLAAHWTSSAAFAAVPLAAVLPLYGSARYCVAIWRREASPNSVTWFLWALAPLIAGLVGLAHGVGLAEVTTLSAALGALLVCASGVAVNPRGSIGRLSPGDLACGVLSLAALLAWWRTSDPRTAVALSLAADLLAGLPTLAKAYRDPRSESVDAYAAMTVAAVLTFVTLRHWSFVGAGFPLYLLLLNLTLTYLTRSGRLEPTRFRIPVHEASTEPGTPMTHPVTIENPSGPSTSSTAREPRTPYTSS